MGVHGLTSWVFANAPSGSAVEMNDAMCTLSDRGSTNSAWCRVTLPLQPDDDVANSSGVNLRRPVALVDASSIMHELYRGSSRLLPKTMQEPLDWAHGGQYAAFGERVRYVFGILRRAFGESSDELHVSIDGPRPVSKVDESLRRASQRIDSVARMRVTLDHASREANYSRDMQQILPLWADRLLAHELRQLGVSHSAELGESDDVLVERAQGASHGGWVLGNDSDYFVATLHRQNDHDTARHFAAGYVPLRTLSVRLDNDTGGPEALSFLVFNVSRFCKHIAHIKPERLPVVATLAGNDSLSDDSLRAIHKIFVGRKIASSGKALRSTDVVAGAFDFVRTQPRSMRPKEVLVEALRRAHVKAGSRFARTVYRAYVRFSGFAGIVDEQAEEGEWGVGEEFSSLPEWVVRARVHGQMSRLGVSLLVHSRLWLEPVAENVRSTTCWMVGEESRRRLYGALRACGKLEGVATVTEYFRRGRSQRVRQVPFDVSAFEGDLCHSYESFRSHSRDARRSLFFRVIDIPSPTSGDDRHTALRSSLFLWARDAQPGADSRAAVLAYVCAYDSLTKPSVVERLVQALCQSGVRATLNRPWARETSVRESTEQARRVQHECVEWLIALETIVTVNDIFGRPIDFPIDDPARWFDGLLLQRLAVQCPTSHSRAQSHVARLSPAVEWLASNGLSLDSVQLALHDVLVCVLVEGLRAGRRPKVTRTAKPAKQRAHEPEKHMASNPFALLG